MVLPWPIVEAAETGDVTTVREWLESGGDPNQNLPSVNSRGFYPEFRLLLIATARDHRAIVSALLEHGADFSCFGAAADAMAALGWLPRAT